MCCSWWVAYLLACSDAVVVVSPASGTEPHSGCGHELLTSPAATLLVDTPHTPLPVTAFPTSWSQTSAFLFPTGLYSCLATSSLFPPSPSSLALPSPTSGLPVMDGGGPSPPALTPSLPLPAAAAAAAAALSFIILPAWVIPARARFNSRLAGCSWKGGDTEGPVTAPPPPDAAAPAPTAAALSAATAEGTAEMGL